MNISFRYIVIIAVLLQDRISSLRADDMSLAATNQKEDCMDEPKTTTTSIETTSPATSTTKIETTSSIVTDTWKLLVIGGFLGSLPYIDDVEKVDPNKKSSKCEKPMPYPTVNDGPTVQAFPDHSVLSCGGFTGQQNGSLKSCYEYDPIHLNWSYMTDMIHERSDTSSVLLNDNEMWVVGGYGNPPPRKTTEVYDRKTKMFRKGPDVPVGMYSHCMAKLNATHVFIGGVESTNQSYNYDISFLVDIAKEPFVFQILPKMDKSRKGAGCGVIRSDPKNGNIHQRYNTSSSKELIIVAGGLDFDQGLPPHGRRDSEIFNIEENRWSKGPTIPRGFYLGGSVSLDDGSVVLVSGYDESGHQQSDVIKLNPSVMEFETMAGELETARSSFGIAVLLDNEDC